MRKNNTIVDLFSGCGGFGLGAEYAGFHTLAAIDIDPILQSSYKKNFPKTKVISGDLAKMDKDSWRIILKGEEVDGVIGGPPCQGYSRIGKSDVSDPRRSLVAHFFRNVNLLKPKFFVMENVEGILDSKNLSELESAIKTVSKDFVVLEPFIIDASDFGAPTVRKRVIVVGYNPSYVANISAEDFNIKINKVNVRDAISDLPAPIPQSNDPDNYGWANYNNDAKLSNYAKEMRKVRRNLGWDISINKIRNGEVSGFFDTVHSQTVKERYAATRPGSTDVVSRSKKLSWDGFCPTLRAGTGSDKGSYQAVRPIHPEQQRVITVREAARLQGFPDWFVFHPTKWHSFRMIGNSVSPLVSKEILKIIKNKIIVDMNKVERKQG